MNTAHELSHPPLEETLPQILDRTTVKRNHVSMYTVGKDYLQESAYAVYNTNGTIRPTRLYIPDMSPSDDYTTNTESDSIMKYNSVDTHALVTTKVRRRDAKMADQFESLSFEEKYAAVSELTQKTLDGIMAASELTETEKQLLIEKAFNRDIGGGDIELAGDRMRTDVAMLTHNHPQPNTSYVPTFELLDPSANDVKLHERIRASTPDHVSGIVGSDYMTNGMILFAAEANREQNADMYDATSEYSRGAKYNLRQLARSGFTYIILELDDHGALVDGQQDELVDFARSIKTK